MYGIEYLDETIMEEAKKQFDRVYPEFPCEVLGANNNRDAVVVKCNFPDGTFYFKVTNNSVSHAYDTLEKAVN